MAKRGSFREAVEYVRKLGLPVELKATYEMGAWRRVASNEHDLCEFLKEGQKLPAIGHVELRWPVD